MKLPTSPIENSWKTLMKSERIFEALPVMVETITPAKAAEYLALNTANRRCSRGHVRALAHQMETGLWRLDGSPIRFARNGALLDGQHRLLACIECEKPFTTFVIRDLDQNAFDTIDTGRTRTAGDSLSIRGESNAHALAAAARVFGVATGKFVVNTKISTREIEELVDKHPKIRDWITFGKDRAFRELLAGGIVSGLGAAFAERDESLALSFWTNVRDGAGLKKDDPAWVLRERLRAMHGKFGHDPSRPMIMAISIKAWNSTVRGQGITLLKWLDTESMPTLV